MSAIMTPKLPPKTNRERVFQFFRWAGIRRFWEAWHPLLIGTSAGVLLLCVNISDVQAGKISADVLPLAVSVAAILAGFQGAMHAIFLTMIRSRAVRFLREKNAYQSLMQYIRSGLVSLVLFVALAILVIAAVSIDILPEYHQVIFSVLAAIYTYSLLASFRIMMLMLRLLQYADE